ncbi:hypothetical protein [Vibrio phage vB_VmeM-Yong XC32]|nr:hypothetical protein [Vibrio phage vB_VmeM-Yong XC31]QAX96384.1 hypothetical protein [Vibrio phage vB_VmeM-Yong XC32]QAX96702.1 hypothetical protein [Vibrio phage vB_VmeM-Yong MS31]QAX97020.1 hypothetical protein [Vibrio phage vB_VmeM-Yong MS32]
MFSPIRAVVVMVRTPLVHKFAMEVAKASSFMDAPIDDDIEALMAYHEKAEEMFAHLAPYGYTCDVFNRHLSKDVLLSFRELYSSLYESLDSVPELQNKDLAPCNIEFAGGPYELAVTYR